MTLLPFLIRYETHFHVPIGDALMALPIAKETGMSLFLPDSFSGNLVASLTDVPIVKKIDKNASVNPIAVTLFENQDHPLNMKNWGNDNLNKKYGYPNATNYYCLALGLKLKVPYAIIDRPADEVKKRVIIVPNGSVQHRSLHPTTLESIKALLLDAGYEVLMGDQQFEDHNAFAKFIASAEYVIAPYTGPMHLAAAMGIKTVAICIGDSPWAYRPLQNNVSIIASDCHECWGQRAGKMCSDQLPYCQKSIHPQYVLDAFNCLDKGEDNIKLVSNPAEKEKINFL
jgi:hypothetical protein